MNNRFSSAEGEWSQEDAANAHVDFGGPIRRAVALPPTGRDLSESLRELRMSRESTQPQIQDPYNSHQVTEEARAHGLPSKQPHQPLHPAYCCTHHIPDLPRYYQHLVRYHPRLAQDFLARHGSPLATFPLPNIQNVHRHSLGLNNPTPLPVAGTLVPGNTIGTTGTPQNVGSYPTETDTTAGGNSPRAGTLVSGKTVIAPIAARATAKEARSTRINYVRNKRRGVEVVRPLRPALGPGIQKRVQNRGFVQKCRELKKVRTKILKEELGALLEENNTFKELYVLLESMDLKGISKNWAQDTQLPVRKRGYFRFADF